MKQAVLCLLLSLLIHPSCSGAQLYPITLQGKQGFIDALGRVVIELKYAEVGKFTEGMAPARTDPGGKWGYVDHTGSLVIGARFDKAREFSDGFAAVCSNSKWQFIDKTGRTAGSGKFDFAYSFSDGLALVRSNGKYEFVDRSVKMAFTQSFDGAWPFTEGLAPVKLKGRWGFIDTTGKMVIQPIYYWVDNFSEGLAYVEGGKASAGYIDRTGKFTIQRRFRTPNPFTEGVAAVTPWPDGKLILIDKKGAKVADLPYSGVGIFSHERARVFTENGCRFIRPDGKAAGDRSYGYATGFEGELACVNIDGKAAYIDSSERTVWGPCDPGSPPSPASQPADGQRTIYPAAPPPKDIRRIGNPQLRRYPDGGTAVYSRGVWDLGSYEGRIYVGGGDVRDNTGPADIYSFAPDEEEFRLEYSAEEEQVTRFYVFDGKLVLPGEDPRESPDLGNIHIKEAGKWRKVRTLPHALHSFSLAYVDRRLYAAITTEILASTDWGRSWSHVAAQAEYVDMVFSVEGKVKAFAWPGSLCTLQDDLLVPSRMIPRLRTVQNIADEEFEFLYFERAAPPTPYRDGVLLTQEHFYRAPGNGKPTPLYYLGPKDTVPCVVALPEGEWAMDVVIRGKRAYVLCAHRGEHGFDNTIYTSSDLKVWKPMMRFATEAFAASMEEWKGLFYVGLASSRDMGSPLPESTGDILCIVPLKQEVSSGIR